MQYNKIGFSDLSGDKCWTDIENHDQTTCDSCSGSWNCPVDLEWSDGDDIGTTVCNFFGSLLVSPTEDYVYLAPGVNLRSAGGSVRATCTICMCEGVGMNV